MRIIVEGATGEGRYVVAEYVARCLADLGFNVHHAGLSIEAHPHGTEFPTRLNLPLRSLSVETRHP